MQIKIIVILCLGIISTSIEAKDKTFKKNTTSKTDIECVAETIYSEARGEPLIGRHAVGATIVTRSTKILHQPACKVVKQQYTQKNIPRKDKEEYYKLAKNILTGNFNNPIGSMDSFDSYKHRYSNRPKHSVKIGNHYFYKALQS